MAVNALPLLLLAGAAAILFARSGKEDEEPEGLGDLPKPGNGSAGNDKPGNSDAGNGKPDNGASDNGGGDPARLPITKDGVVVGTWDGDELVCVAGWKVSSDGTDCIRSLAPSGGESGQSGDVRWDVFQEGAGWRWRAWRYTVSYSKSGWSDTGVSESRTTALARAKDAADELKLLDTARLNAVEADMDMVKAYNPASSAGTPSVAYPPLKQVLIERGMGPNISYGLNMYEDGLTRQDGRYLVYLVIPEDDRTYIERTKSSAQIADPDDRIEAKRQIMMFQVEQYW